MFRFLLISSALIACACAASFRSADGAATGNSYSDIQPDGSYKYTWESSNGIAAQESGHGGEIVNGGFSYYSPEGELVQLSYVADGNGFQPQGSHLPTPPPIPHYILKSLEYNALHPQPEDFSQHQRTLSRAPVRKLFG